MNRVYAILGAVAAIAGIVVWVLIRSNRGGDAPPDPGTSAGSAHAIATNDLGGGSPSAPSLPPGVHDTAGSAKNPQDYMVGDVHVRDHRGGDSKPLDLPPNIHPANARELPSTLTNDISQQVRKLVYTCAADLPKDTRGPKPRLDGQLTVGIKDHTLSITKAVTQLRDVPDGPGADAIRQCVEQKSIGMTSVAADQADLDDYGIQITFAIPR